MAKKGKTPGKLQEARAAHSISSKNTARSMGSIGGNISNGHEGGHQKQRGNNL